MTKLNAKIEIKALTTADHVFAESEYTKKLLQPIVSAPRLSVAIPGVDTSLFHPSLHEGNTKGDYILSVGRFADPRKNVRLLFAAYHQLRKRLLNAPRLVLAGKTAPTKADWQFAVDLGIAAWIDVRNNIDITELARLYRCAQLFVLSSNEEGLGMVILEAMASGLPVVSTRSGGPETAVTEEENGFLTPLGNPEILADRMYLILTNSEVRLALGMAGRRTAELRFSLDVAGQKYLKIYDGLVGVDC
jgi:glycosyltransferase involved in cell wall biosynthesis